MKRLIENILKKSNSGFTMIELSIVILVMAIFGTLTAEILSNATKIYSESLKRQQFISEARSSFLKFLESFHGKNTLKDLSKVLKKEYLSILEMEIQFLTKFVIPMIF